MTEISRVKRMLIFTAGFIEALLFAGCIFGWSSLLFVLKEDGIYSNLCNAVDATINNGTQSLNYTEEVVVDVGVVELNPNSTIQVDIPLPGSTAATEVLQHVPPHQHKYPTCAEQDSMLALVFTIANLCFTLYNPLIGTIFDKFGTRLSRLMASTLLISGGIFLAFTTTDIPHLIFPGMSLFAMGGMQLYVSNLQIGSMFGKRQSTVVTIYSGSFDTSSVGFLLVKIAYDNGISRQHSMYFYTSLVAIVLLNTFLLMPKFKVFTDEKQTKGEQLENGEEMKTLRSQNTIDEKNDAKTDIQADNEDKSDQNSHLAADNHTDLQEDHIVKGNESIKPIKRYVFSLLYMFHIIWITIGQLRFIFLVGSMNALLNVRANGDHETVSFLTNVLSYFMMCGLLCAPFAGMIMDKHSRIIQSKKSNSAMSLLDNALSTSIALTITCIMMIGVSVLVLIPVLELLYIAFLFVVVFRSFLYGTAISFIGKVFPMQYFGSLLGLMYFISGAIATLQFPLFIWAEGPPKDPTYPNALLLALAVVSTIHPIYIIFKHKQSSKLTGLG
ncbi:unnamed protein product [Owenia fusiformis]|uniref:Uncharacterized protein n=1 Tax=Owenia fusiformis TaxID=6347 RepID=A0A8J1XYE0_OWEFU|nr:unnamed protein product [Owenia fusiformis]